MLQKFLINDFFILALIVINAAVLFLDSFDTVRQSCPWLIRIDFFISLFFIIEMILKIRLLSWKTYISDKWNVFDCLLNLSIFPSFILFVMDEPHVLFLTIIRLVRIARFLRFFRFIPLGNLLWKRLLPSHQCISFYQNIRHHLPHDEVLHYRGGLVYGRSIWEV